MKVLHLLAMTVMAVWNTSINLANKPFNVNDLQTGGRHGIRIIRNIDFRQFIDSKSYLKPQKRQERKVKVHTGTQPLSSAKRVMLIQAA
jgi:hypothetical protein